MNTIVSVIIDPRINDRWGISGERSYSHNLESNIKFANNLAYNLAIAIVDLSGCTFRVASTDNFPDVFYIVISL